jgi:hypothetical protein
VKFFPNWWDEKSRAVAEVPLLGSVPAEMYISGVSPRGVG